MTMWKAVTYDDEATSLYIPLQQEQERYQGIVKKTVTIQMVDFGPSINLDFDHNGKPVGFELYVPDITSEGRTELLRHFDITNRREEERGKK